MSKQAIIFIAPPGAGKGTQAELIAARLGLEHIETSKLIEYKFKNADLSDEKMREEKKRWLEGGLTDPLLFAGWFNEEVREVVSRGKGIVTSGSLRTLKESEIVTPELERLYGKGNITIVYITLSEAESIKRNSGRRICQLNRHPIPNFPQYLGLTACPEDGSPLIIRELDKPEIIKHRYEVFLLETAPVLDYLKANGYRVIEVNGERPIEKVTEDIFKNLEARK